ncbi:antibiotic biosynthesis monooxygenase [Aureococcus anophagefferens]|nr:antibiotic biosynthesis monooxygenase [Aureococcus anophagefferens]
MVDANAMDATLARSERLSMYQLRCDAREREVAELEARSRLPRDVLELPAAPLADVRSSYENLSNVAAVKVRPPPPARDDARDAQAENDELRRRLDALEAARRAAAALAGAPPRSRRPRSRQPWPPRRPRPRRCSRRAAADARAVDGDVENQRLRDSASSGARRHDQLEKQPRGGAAAVSSVSLGGGVPVERPTPPQLARLEMSTHRERQWQRIYVSR